MTVQLLILKVRTAAAAHSASDGSMGPPAGSQHSHQKKLLVMSDIVFQEKLFLRSNELLLCATPRYCLFAALSQCFTSICFLRCSFASTKTSYKAELLSLILAEACKALTEDKVSF